MEIPDRKIDGHSIPEAYDTLQAYADSIARDAELLRNAHATSVFKLMVYEYGPDHIEHAYLQMCAAKYALEELADVVRNAEKKYLSREHL